jgi:hypothetical protein
MKEHVERAEGKPGILIPGLGAVSTGFQLTFWEIGMVWYWTTPII